VTSTTATTPDLNDRFEQDVAPHLAQLYPAAMRMTGNPWDADDLVQETMLKAYTSIHQLREDSSSRAWLRRILANTFISRCRRQRELCTGEIPAPTARSAETDALARLPDSDLVRAMRRLPEDHRLAIYLADVEGYRHEEIADMTGMSAAAVKSSIHRGRIRLRDSLTTTKPGRHETTAASIPGA
jgi:RNA polymerase sigma-70 factor (ECF subfamily)